MTSKKTDQPKAENKEKNKGGRPTIYSVELVSKLCAEMSSGRSLRSICQDDDMPAQATVFRWLYESSEFKEQYTKARESQMDAMVEDMLTIADDTDVVNVQKDRLRIDTRKWVMSKLAPKRYGDKLGITDGEGGALKVMIQRFGENKSSGDDNTSE